MKEKKDNGSESKKEKVDYFEKRNGRKRRTVGLNREEEGEMDKNGKGWQKDG